jgi:hypothetical protein
LSYFGRKLIPRDCRPFSQRWVFCSDSWSGWSSHILRFGWTFRFRSGDDPRRDELFNICPSIPCCSLFLLDPSTQITTIGQRRILVRHNFHPQKYLSIWQTNRTFGDRFVSPVLGATLGCEIISTTCPAYLIYIGRELLPTSDSSAFFHRNKSLNAHRTSSGHYVRFI